MQGFLMKKSRIPEMDVGVDKTRGDGKAPEVENFLARIDYSKCVQCGHCVDICPRGILKDQVMPEKKEA